MDQTNRKLSQQAGKLLTQNHMTVATAESCTGGLLSHTLTGVSGSSAYFMGGIIAYDNRIKMDFLGVRIETLRKHGAVSRETAREMALGIRKAFDVDIGLSTTGIAGPTGGTPQKPVGLVWIGLSTARFTETFECHFDGDREHNKRSTVQVILSRLLESLSTE
jgi:nicotinamide-nucleotide amidase